MNGSEINRDSYNQIAAEWDEVRNRLSDRERRYLDVFLRGLPVPSRILDMGCGTGRPIAEYVVLEGHSLTGVDQSSGMLNLAKERMPEQMWVESRIEEFYSEEKFAGVICWDSLFHIEREHHGQIFNRITQMLLPGGRLMLTVGGSENPPFTDTMFDERFFYDSFAPDQVCGMLADVGYAMLIAEYISRPDGGRDKGRYAIVAEYSGTRTTQQ